MKRILLLVLGLILAGSVFAINEQKTNLLDLRGSVSGSVKLQAPATGGAVTFTLPAVDGSVGEVLSTNGSATLQFSNAGNWQKFTVAHTALQTAGTTNDLELFSALTNASIERIVIKHSTAFSGGAISAYTISVGIATDLGRYATAFDVFQTIGDDVKQASLVINVESFSGVSSIRISAVSTSADLDQSVAGSVDIWVKKSVIE